MKVYLDSSVVLHRLLEQPGAIRHWREWEWAVTSELMRVEVFRTLDRLRVDGKLNDQGVADTHVLFRKLTAWFEEIPLRSAVLQRASAPLSTRLGTLDAIHLATALIWIENHEEPLTFLTHDMQLATAARACGLEALTGKR